MPEHDLRELRSRLEALEARVAAAARDRAPRAVFQVGRVVNGGSMPSVVPACYRARLALVVPGASENASGSVTPGAYQETVRVIGPSVPSIGDDLVLHDVPYRWEAARYAKDPTVGPTVPNCPCIPMPRTITQTSAGLNQKYRSCTYSWGSSPPDAPFTDRNYYSHESFLDDATGDVFYHYVTCANGFIYLGRWFPGGGHANEGTIFQWLVGMPGNSCSPFVMSNGQIQPGIVSPQYVTLSGS